jgi:hypothetical protein
MVRRDDVDAGRRRVVGPGVSFEPRCEWLRVEELMDTLAYRLRKRGLRLAVGACRGTTGDEVEIRN